MEELLIRLMNEAKMQQAVAINTLRNGMKLLVYPLQNGMLVALGIGMSDQTQTKNILRKRRQSLTRFGCWLPAVFNDGSLYLIRRLSEYGDGTCHSLYTELVEVEELLH